MAYIWCNSTPDKHPGGRPLKYQMVDEIDPAIQNYFAGSISAHKLGEVTRSRPVVSYERDRPGILWERPSRSPRSSSWAKEPLAGTVSRELTERLPNGFWWAGDGLGAAKAGAAPTTREPRTTAVLTSVFAIIVKGPFRPSSASVFGRHQSYGAACTSVSLASDSRSK